MADLMDINPMQKYMGFYVGPNGCGKSIAIASWMDLGPVYFFDYDGRMNSVAAWYKKRGLKNGQLLTDTYGPENLYDSIVKLKELVQSCPYSAIVIDSFTAATVSAVTFSIFRRLGKGQRDVPKMTKGDMIVPDWDEWNAEAMYITMMLDYCKQIASQGTAVFWTGHPVQRMNIKQAGNTQEITYQTKYAAFGHKSDSLIPIYFNEIYAFYVSTDITTGVTSRICQTQPYGEVAAKTAFELPVKLDWTNRNFREVFLENLGRTEQLKAPPAKLGF